MRLGRFRALTFDCYGTLIDWESGIFAGLRPLLERGGAMMARDTVLELYARHEAAQEAETPGMLYSELLGVVQGRVARDLGVVPDAGEQARFGASVKDWPAFADSVAALGYLKQHFQLVILSNVDRASFAASNVRLGIEFDAIYTAQDVGSYKPDPANFRHLIARMAARGVEQREILHTAQSLFHDHVPARRLGLASAWIDRRHDQPGWGATAPVAGAEYDFRFTSLEAMAAAHRQEVAE